MTADLLPGAALYYDPDAFVEKHARSTRATGPAGLMGRQVAGKEFLDAYLTHAQAASLTAVVRTQERADSLVQYYREHPAAGRRPHGPRIFAESEIFAAATTTPPFGDVLHYPCPPDVRFAWARQATGCRFAMSGVTHTLSSLGATQSLCDLVVAPFEPFDALICTSRAVEKMVRAATETYADYLRERSGGAPRLCARLATIPLGVNEAKFKPATADERRQERGRLGAAVDDVVVLCVGRLSHHAKAHPFPLFYAANEAARRTGRSVLLVFAGWAAHPAVESAFRDGARLFAPAARAIFVDGHDPAVRTGVWKAADIFALLPDNIQETFGLVVVEAMASGVPVLGSDWDGYRDLIVDGTTGYLAPTHMVAGATESATTRLLFGQINYDHFLAETSQAVTVDPFAAAEALTRLVADEALRAQMGSAGRARVLANFTWQRVVRAYEELWEEQRAVLRATAAAPPTRGPALYPALDVSFAGYPSRWLDDRVHVCATEQAGQQLALFLQAPLTNHVPVRRCTDAVILTKLLNSARTPQTLASAVQVLRLAGVESASARATVAWLLKYALLRIAN